MVAPHRPYRVIPLVKTRRVAASNNFSIRAVIVRGASPEPRQVVRKACAPDSRATHTDLGQLQACQVGSFGLWRW